MREQTAREKGEHGPSMQEQTGQTRKTQEPKMQGREFAEKVFEGTKFGIDTEQKARIKGRIEALYDAEHEPKADRSVAIKPQPLRHTPRQQPTEPTDGTD